MYMLNFKKEKNLAYFLLLDCKSYYLSHEDVWFYHRLSVKSG